MRIIVTGGSGLIGRALTESLAADGHEVILLSRAPDRVQGLPAGTQAVYWDGRTADGWGELVDGVDFEDEDFGMELLKRSLQTDRLVALWWD